MYDLCIHILQQPEYDQLLRIASHGLAYKTGYSLENGNAHNLPLSLLNIALACFSSIACHKWISDIFLCERHPFCSDRLRSKSNP
jgi:hypothetical protein